MNQATQGNIDFYDEFAHLYPEVFSFLDPQATVDQWIQALESVGAIPSSSERTTNAPRLLDAGCGPGWFMIAWAKAGFEVVGMDSSPNMLRYAEDEWRRAFPNRPCHLIQANLCDPSSLPALLEPFDLVVAHSHLLNLIHPDDLGGLFESISACLRTDTFCAFDHSRFDGTPPGGLEEHSVSRGHSVSRQSSYDARHACATQTWAGGKFRGQETYWFHELPHLDTIAGHSRLQLWRRAVWSPNQVPDPSEHILSVYRRR